jgi:hypothetical protein
MFIPMFVLYEERTRDLLRNRRVFTPLCQISCQLVCKIDLVGYRRSYLSGHSRVSVRLELEMYQLPLQTLLSKYTEITQETAVL